MAESETPFRDRQLRKSDAQTSWESGGMNKILTVSVHSQTYTFSSYGLTVHIASTSFGVGRATAGAISSLHLFTNVALQIWAYNVESYLRSMGVAG